jgi:hypothetical protein
MVFCNMSSHYLVCTRGVAKIAQGIISDESATPISDKPNDYLDVLRRYGITCLRSSRG